MKSLIKSVAWLILLALASASGRSYASKNPHNVWTLETKEDVEAKYFLEDGKYFFVRAEDWMHFFDGENGKEVWKLRIPDYEKAGLHLMWNEKVYIVSNENEELACYDVYTGKVIWQQKYKDIDQDDYSFYKNTEAGVVLFYNDMALCVDFDNGKELWRRKIRLDGSRTEKDLPNTWWTWGAENGNRFLFATKDGLLLLDAQTGKELWSKDAELTDKEEVDAVTFYGSKALLMYDNDMLGFLDVKNGKELWTKKEKIDDIEGYSTIKNAAGGDYLLLSFDDTQTMVNLTNGTIAWETKPDAMVGILTKYAVMDNGKNVVCYFKQKNAPKERGTYLVLYNLEIATGKVVYKEKIAFTEWAPPTGFANFLSKALTGKKAFEAGDYGFVFSEYEVDGDVVFLIRGTSGASGMANPLTREDEGEGLVRMNLATGKVVYRTYFPLNKESSFWSKANFDITAAPAPVVEGDNIFVVGAERLVSANVKSGKINWKIEEDLGFPVDWGILENTIYLKVGYQAFDVSLNAKSGNVDAKKSWNKDPYRIYALDAATGKTIWKIDFTYDPGLAMPGGEVKIDPLTRTLIGADEEHLFAVRLSRDAGGKRLWSLKFDDDLKVGELDHEECYAVTRTSSSSTSVGWNYTTTTTSYSASAQFVLYPVVRGDHIIVFGPEGVASVSLDGKVQWRTKWKWAGKKVTLPPQFLNNGKIVYMVKEDIQLMDEKTGTIHWMEEDDYDATPIIPPNNKLLYMLEKDEIRVYKMSE
jgi:outer membrane protein assembly factor BamB